MNEVLSQIDFNRRGNLPACVAVVGHLPEYKEEGKELTALVLSILNFHPTVSAYASLAATAFHFYKCSSQDKPLELLKTAVFVTSTVLGLISPKKHLVFLALSSLVVQAIQFLNEISKQKTDRKKAAWWLANTVNDSVYLISLKFPRYRLCSLSLQIFKEAFLWRFYREFYRDGSTQSFTRLERLERSLLFLLPLLRNGQILLETNDLTLPTLKDRLQEALFQRFLGTIPQT